MSQPRTYRVTLSDGRAFDVTTDGLPPSEADVLAGLDAEAAPAQPGRVRASVGAVPSAPVTRRQAAGPPTWSDRLGLNEPTSSRGVGFLRGSGASVVDALEGVKAGGVSTLFHGGDLIRRGLGMERVIARPAVQSAMTPPASMAGQVGFMGEQAAEFAVPLTRLSLAMKGAGLAKRAAVDAAAAAGVAGVQTGGDSGAMTVGAALGGALPVAGAIGGAALNTAKRAAAGATEGGVGGAVASAVRRVVPSDTRTMLIQGLKPRATKTGFEASLGKAVPEIKAAEAALGKPIENVDDLLKAAKLAKQSIRRQYDEMAGPMRQMGSTIDGNAVADAIVSSIPRKLRIDNPARVKAIMKRAERYRRDFDLEDAEQLLRETNAELDSFYSRYPQAQRKALDSDPKAAQLVAQAKAWRDAIYKRLDDPGQGAAARELNRRYGAVLDVEDAAFRRANVAKRQQPESLSEQIGSVRAAGEFARGAYKLATGNISGAADIASGAAMRDAGRFLKEQQTTDALIKRAFASYRGGPPEAVVMPAVRPVRGLLERGAIPMEAGPDSSYVRGVPARPAVSGRKALPPAREIREAGPVPDTSGPIDPVLPENYKPETTPDFGIDDVKAPPAAPSGDNERAFLLRWLADDLEAMPYQAGGTTQRGRLAASGIEDEVERKALGFNPRVAGTPTQEMFHAMGIRGSREKIRQALERTIRGRRGHPKIEALLDAMQQAWDGQRFDWQLVNDETIFRMGIRRSNLRAPATMPNADDSPSVFRRFFVESDK